jgi:F0F1-type ATP synthase delta subunit
MNPVISAVINLLETFVENNQSAWVAELLQELESFLPKAKAQLKVKLESPDSKV